MISKLLAGIGAFALLSGLAVAQSTPPAMSVPTPLPASVSEWNQLPVTPTNLGVRRAVFDGPTATVDNVHCHATTLNPGAQSSDAYRHLRDEIIIVKDGTVEVLCDGATQMATAGAVIFFPAEAVTALRNAGDGPATYYVISYATPRTPKR